MRKASNKPPGDRQARLRIVELEIQFARGWNSVTSAPLPRWQLWKHKLKSTMTDFDAFELGVSEYHYWSRDLDA